MARSRNIKPGFFRNELLAEMDFGTRLLFVGLWTLADKAGRLEDRPKKIKIELFPADDVDVPCMIHALAKHDFITRYAVKGIGYIQINNFLKHQSPHHKEAESELPGVDKADVEEEKSNDESDSSAFMNDEQPMHEPSTNDASPEKSASSPLIPDSLIPDSGYLIPEQNTCASGDAPTVDSSAPKQDDLYSEEFNRFWQAYPSKKGKKPAAEKFRALRKRHTSKEFLDRLIEDVRCRARGHEWTKSNGQFVPMASTYLNQERWNDPAPNVSQLQSRHNGFDDRDYSEGIIKGVPDDAANF